MPQFDPELIEVLKKVLEDTMPKVPVEHSTPAAKAYFAEFILKAAAQGHSPDAALPISGRCGIPDHGTFVERKVLSRNGQALARENGMAPTALLAVGWRCNRS
jgi:hypothetical protein